MATNLTWGEGEPNNYGGDEDCTLLGWKSIGIADMPCLNRYPYICEKVL